MNHPERTLRSLLQLDATACLALAGAGLFFTSWLREEMGLQVTWPIRATTAFLALYGVVQFWVARHPTPRAVASLAFVDGLFALGVVTAAFVDLAEAAPWLRWALVALGLGVGAFGLAKRRLSRAVDTSRAHGSTAVTSS